MLDTVETVATQSVQLWLRRPEEELGSAAAGSTVTSFVDSFDTYSSMSHLLDREAWPPEDRPATVVYLCSSMADGDNVSEARRRVRADAIRYLDQSIGHYLPGSVLSSGFDWDLLCGAPPGTGPAAIDAQHLVANVDASDRYVQALPGTSHVAAAAGRLHVRHLHLAGDWTDCGLNAGCIEAAVMSGVQAANSVLGLPRWSGITGEWR